MHGKKEKSPLEACGCGVSAPTAEQQEKLFAQSPDIHTCGKSTPVPSRSYIERRGGSAPASHPHIVHSVLFL